jgi:hypothetical protein
MLLMFVQLVRFEAIFGANHSEEEVTLGTNYIS